jgi:hypothetical protein
MLPSILVVMKKIGFPNFVLHSVQTAKNYYEFAKPSVDDLNRSRPAARFYDHPAMVDSFGLQGGRFVLDWERLAPPSL